VVDHVANKALHRVNELRHGHHLSPRSGRHAGTGPPPGSSRVQRSGRLPGPVVSRRVASSGLVRGMV
jgi:hypothetical protein